MYTFKLKYLDYFRKTNIFYIINSNKTITKIRLQAIANSNNIKISYIIITNS